MTLQTSFLELYGLDVISSFSPDLTPIEWDQALRLHLAQSFIGVDEAGRGPLAGPVAAAAVVLPEDHGILELRDSKRIGEAEREVLAAKIKEKALCWSVAFVEPQDIDEINILNAALKAMLLAIEGLNTEPYPVVVDGNKKISGLSQPQATVVKGDAKSASIAAASILAKTARDQKMAELDLLYPGYGFARHKGYPTADHYRAIRELGHSIVHRKTFKGVLE